MRIQNSFNKASSSYEQVAQVQRQTAEFLTNRVLEQIPALEQSSGLDKIPALERISSIEPIKTILDLGTGTGYVPELFMSTTLEFYLNDFAPSMLDFCRQKFSEYKNVYYLPGDMLEITNKMLNNVHDHDNAHAHISTVAKTFDLIISNLALQWLPNLIMGIKHFLEQKPKIFAFSTLLDGTFHEWQRLINNTETELEHAQLNNSPSTREHIQLNNYPSAAELIANCQNLMTAQQKLQHWQQDIVLHFEQPAEFINYLRKLGAINANSDNGDISTHINFNPHIDFKTLRRFLTKLKAGIYDNQPLSVTYKIFFGIII